MEKVSAGKYVECVESIAVEKPEYQEGHDGSDGKCDCIGMCRGALIRAGLRDIKYMNGTNQAARKTIQNLQKIKKVGQLRVGDVVLKVRDKDDPSMRLPDRYRKGQANYDPDIVEINFTHIGTVTSINPLRITHMTSPTAKVDDDLGNWKYFGSLPWVAYDGEEESEIPPANMVTVFAESGKTVKMRAKPSALCRLYWDVPVGSSVVLINPGETWSEIIWNQRTGYMMSKYLSNDVKYAVIIHGLTKAQADELSQRFPGSNIQAERG